MVADLVAGRIAATHADLNPLITFSCCACLKRQRLYNTHAISVYSPLASGIPIAMPPVEHQHDNVDTMLTDH
jgi:hypothetical protein